MDRFEQLEQLGRLRATGELTEEEFNQLKQALLSREAGPQRSSNRTRLIATATAIVAILVSVALWAISNPKGSPATSAEATTATVADPAATASPTPGAEAPTTKLDKFSDLWDVNPVKDGSTQVCFGEVKDTSVAVSYRMDNGSLYFDIGRSYATALTSPNSLMGTLVFSDGSTIRNNLTRIASTGEVRAIVMDGSTFLEYALRSDSVKLRTASGNYEVMLLGRVDLGKDMLACFDETKQAGSEKEEPSNEAPAPKKAKLNPKQEALARKWGALESECRGSDDEAKSKRACALREKALDDMNKAGVCHGKDGEYESDMRIHICSRDSIR